METIITIFTVLSMYMNAIENNSEYYYNADIDNGILRTMYVYENHTDGLTPKLAIHFDYDDYGRLTEKEVCRWDMWEKDYQPDYKLQYTYFDDGYELARSTWEGKKNTWKSDEKMVYHFGNDNQMNVSHLFKDNRGNYHTMNNIVVNGSYDNLLLAVNTH